MKRVFLFMITILILSATQASANFLLGKANSWQATEVGEPFDPLVAVVYKTEDIRGERAADVTVRFTLQQGPSTTFSANPVLFTVERTTDDNGVARLYLKGGSVGEYTVVAFLPEKEEQFFLYRLTVIDSDTEETPETPETPTIIPHRYEISGNEQTGEIGTELENPLIVKIFDENDNPLPNISVLFTAIVDGELCFLEVNTDSNGEAGIYFTLGDIAGSYQVNATFEVDKKWEIVFTVYATELPVISDPTPPLNPTPDPPVDDPNPDPPVVNNPDPPVVNNPDPPVVNNPDPPVVNNPDPPRNPPPADDSNSNPLPVFQRPQTLDPNEIWHVMYRNDDGQATVFVYPRCVNNPHHNPPKPACENDYGITEELLSQVTSNFAIEIQGKLEDVNDMLDLKLTQDNASLVKVGGVQGVVN